MQFCAHESSVGYVPEAHAIVCARVVCRIRTGSKKKCIDRNAAFEHAGRMYRAMEAWRLLRICSGHFSRGPCHKKESHSAVRLAFKALQLASNQFCTMHRNLASSSLEVDVSSWRPSYPIPRHLEASQGC